MKFKEALNEVRGTAQQAVHTQMRQKARAEQEKEFKGKVKDIKRKVKVDVQKVVNKQAEKGRLEAYTSPEVKKIFSGHGKWVKVLSDHEGELEVLIHPSFVILIDKDDIIEEK